MRGSERGKRVCRWCEGLRADDGAGGKGPGGGGRKEAVKVAGDRVDGLVRIECSNGADLGDVILFLFRGKRMWVEEFQKSFCYVFSW